MDKRGKGCRTHRHTAGFIGVCELERGCWFVGRKSKRGGECYRASPDVVANDDDDKRRRGTCNLKEERGR